MLAMINQNSAMSSVRLNILINHRHPIVVRGDHHPGPRRLCCLS